MFYAGIRPSQNQIGRAWIYLTGASHTNGSPVYIYMSLWCIYYIYIELCILFRYKENSFFSQKEEKDINGQEVFFLKIEKDNGDKRCSL
jgi:hypothetical protein